LKRVPAVSLVIAVYGHEDFLERIFVSLERQSFEDFEVVLADDGSGPRMAELVARWQGRLRHPILHAWQENQGFRKTVIVNRAVAQSRGDHLVFIDGDCILHHRFLERHHRRRRPGQAHSGRRLMLDGALTARIGLEDVRSGRLERPSFWWRHVEAHDRRNGFYAPWLYGLRGGFGGRYEILGSNFSLPRAAFLAVNGYDERIVGRGLEDVNLKARLVNAGVAVRSIAQEAIQYHCHHESSGFPHDAGTVARFGRTSETWTPQGITKATGPPGTPAR
jgi:glycosyltransferase involved in cell wall biosynthesis